MFKYHCSRYGGIGEIPREEDNPVIEIRQGSSYRNYLTTIVYAKPLNDKEIYKYELMPVGAEVFRRYSDIGINDFKERLFKLLEDRGVLNQEEAFSGDWWYGWDEVDESLGLDPEIDGIDIHILNDEDWKLYVYKAVKDESGKLVVDMSEEIVAITIEEMSFA